MRVEMRVSEDELVELLTVAVRVKYPDLVTIGKLRFEISSYSYSLIYIDSEVQEEETEE